MNRSGQIAVQIFNNLDRRLKSADKKDQPGLRAEGRGQGREGKQKMGNRKRHSEKQTPSSPSTVSHCKSADEKDLDRGLESADEKDLDRRLESADEKDLDRRLESADKKDKSEVNIIIEQRCYHNNIAGNYIDNVFLRTG